VLKGRFFSQLKIAWGRFKNYMKKLTPRRYPIDKKRRHYLTNPNPE